MPNVIVALPNIDGGKKEERKKERRNHRMKI